MHPEVSRDLFEEQVKRITGNPDLLLDRGWLVLTATYPVLTIAVRHRATSKLRTFRFGFDNWNDLPPALAFIDAETAEELASNFWPTDTQSHWASERLRYKQTLHVYGGNPRIPHTSVAYQRFMGKL